MSELRDFGTRESVAIRCSVVVLVEEAATNEEARSKGTRIGGLGRDIHGLDGLHVGIEKLGGVLNVEIRKGNKAGISMNGIGHELAEEMKDVGCILMLCGKGIGNEFDGVVLATITTSNDLNETFL